MKKLILAAALVLAVAGPASAQRILPAGVPRSPQGAMLADPTTDLITAVPNQTFGSLTIFPYSIGARKKAADPAAGVYAPGVFLSIEFTPSTTRTVPSFGMWNATYAPSGVFAGVRGFYNYTDVSTPSGTGNVFGIRNDVFLRAGTTGNVFGQYNGLFAQNTGSITVATGMQTVVENDGSGTIASGIGFLGVISNAGGGTITQGIAFYAASNTLPAASKASFYGEPGSGQAEFDDGSLSPITSHNASTVLTITSNVIAPSNAIHHLGAGLVKTITKPATCTPTCSIMIVPDAAFTTDTTGNISLASTAVINKTLIFVWDGTKWNPSY